MKSIITAEERNTNLMDNVKTLSAPKVEQAEDKTESAEKTAE